MFNVIGKLGTLIFLVAFAAISHKVAAEDSTAAVTEQVLNQHLKAFGAGDMDALLADYSEEAVILTPNGTIKGHAEIQPVFAGLFEEFAKPGASFEMKQIIIEGNVAYIVWMAETADNIYELATDTFVVRDGKIAVQSFTAKTTPKNN